MGAADSTDRRDLGNILPIGNAQPRQGNRRRSSRRFQDPDLAVQDRKQSTANLEVSAVVAPLAYREGTRD